MSASSQVWLHTLQVGPKEYFFDCDFEVLALSLRPTHISIKGQGEASESGVIGPTNLLYLESGNPRRVLFRETAKILVICVDKIWFNTLLTRLDDETEASQSVSLEDCRPVSTHPDYPGISQSLRRHIASPIVPNDLFLDTSVRLLLSRHINAARRVGANISTPLPQSFAREDVLAEIENALPNKLTVGDLASRFGMTPPRFSRSFRNVVGETPQTYILRRRVMLAKARIDGGQRVLANVAYDAGFSSQSHLTIMFGRYIGIPPGRYMAAKTDAKILHLTSS